MKKLSFTGIVIALIIFILSTTNVAAAGQSQILPANIESNLASFCQTHRSNRTGQLYALAEEQALSLFEMDSKGWPLVHVWVHRDAEGFAATLENHGARVQRLSEQYHLIEAWINPSAIPGIAAMPNVLSITPVFRPILHAGKAMTQGDALLHADDVRDPAQFPPNGYDGMGIKVGVLSDSVNRVGGGLAASVGSGDLPDGMDVLMDYTGGDATDEGRALMEIIHDIVPGAQLAFHTAMHGELDYAQGIRDLAEAGARVIVDDICFVTEPFFENGIVGQAVNEVVSRYGVVYVTAAGNENGRFHSAPFRDDGGGWHDFDPSEAVDSLLHVTVPAGDRGIVVLQWSDPWYTETGVTNNFDLYAYNPDSSLADSERTDNLSTKKPYELMLWGGHPVMQTTYDIAIRRVCGSGEVQLKLWALHNVIFDEYGDGSSIIGHAIADGAITVGAVPFYAPDEAEPFSSRGPVVVYSDSQDETLRTPEVRYKPDVVAPDNINTSFFGRDIAEDEDQLPNFPGTSAAAPHIAAVAAQMLSAQPYLSPEQVGLILRSTAKDLGAAGWDNVSGYGIVDALAAVRDGLSTSDVSGPIATLLSPPVSTARPVGFASIQFSEAVQPSTALDAANYDLRSTGDDGQFGTTDDVVCTLTPTYDTVTHRVELALAAKLPVGYYQLTLLPAITDLTGNPLNDGTAQIFTFERTLYGEPFEVGGAGQFVAVAPDGEAIFAFTPADFSATMATIFDASGAPVTMSFAVDAGFHLQATSVAYDPTGHFIVGYSDKRDVDERHAYITKLDMAGRSEWLATVQAIWELDSPDALAVDKNGNVYVAVRERPSQGEDYILLRKFDTEGRPLTDMIRVDVDDPTTEGIRDDLSIASDSSGNFVVTWVQSRTKIVARLFDANCQALTEPFIVAVGSMSARASVARNDRFFAVVWTTGAKVPERIFERWTTFLRLYDNDGRPISEAIRVDSPGLFEDAKTPRVAVDPLGGITVTYLGSNDSEHSHLMLRRFDSSGQALGMEFEVPDDTISSSSGSALGVDGEDNVLVAWDGWARWLMNPTPEMADLGVEDITVPQQITPGVVQEVSATLWYWGTPLHEVGMRYTLSADGVLGNTDDRPLVDFSVSELYDGSRVTDKREFVLPIDIASGTWWLFAQVDADRQIAEVDETNNSMSIPIQVSAPPKALGDESVVNTDTVGDQRGPAVAMAPDGRYVVVWSEGHDISARRYDAFGSPLGPEFRVNTTTAWLLQGLSIAMSASGGFIVVWTDSDRQGDKFVRDVYGRIYDSSGQPVGGELLFNDDATDGDQQFPGVGIDASGQIIVVWLDSTQYIYRRRFDAAGTPLGPSIRLDQSAGATPVMGTLSLTALDGRSVIIWGTGWGVVSFFAQWFELNDLPQGNPIQIDSPSAAIDSQGRLAVAFAGWTADTGSDVYVRFFGADGTALTDPVKVNTYEASGQHNPSITFDGSGHGVMVWVSDLQGGNSRVIGRRLDSSGQPVGGEFYVSEVTSGVPAMAMSADGHFAVAWTFLGNRWDIASRSFIIPPSDLSDLQANKKPRNSIKKLLNR